MQPDRLYLSCLQLLEAFTQKKLLLRMLLCQRLSHYPHHLSLPRLFLLPHKMSRPLRTICANCANRQKSFLPSQYHLAISTLRLVLMHRTMSYQASLRRCVMLKDADFNYFPAVYVVCGYTDMRSGIDSLAAIIERKYKVNLFVPNTLFLFCGRSSTRIKGLLWEGDGFLLLYKRVEQGRFVWPRTSEELRQLRPEQFKWLMQGFALDSLIYDIQPGYSA